METTNTQQDGAALRKTYIAPAEPIAFTVFARVYQEMGYGVELGSDRLIVTDPATGNEWYMAFGTTALEDLEALAYDIAELAEWQKQDGAK